MNAHRAKSVIRPVPAVGSARLGYGAASLTVRSAVPAAPSTMTVLDPADGRLVGELGIATAGDVEAAVESARKAARAWARTSARERAAGAADAARAVAAAADALARPTTRQRGKPLDDARG